MGSHSDNERFRAVKTGSGWKVEEHDGCERCGRYHTVLYIYYLMPRSKQENLAKTIADLLSRAQEPTDG